jgi:hypothetical protein
MGKFIKPLTTAEYQGLKSGLPTYCASSTFVVAGQSLTTPQVVTLIDNVLNPAAAVPPAKAAWLAASATAVEATDGVTVREVTDVLEIMFKNSPTTLANLAIAPRKTPKPLSVEARAAATAEAKATRTARGTLGKKQKAAIGQRDGGDDCPRDEPRAGSGSARADRACTGGRQWQAAARLG